MFFLETLGVAMTGRFLCIPSHPSNFPAVSSTLPSPWLELSLFSPAAFIASMAWFLSCSPDVAHAWLPVTLPIVA